MINSDIMDSMDNYSKQYSQQQGEYLTQAKNYWNELEDHRQRLEVQQDRYYRLSSDAEQSDVEIEQALLDHEKGLLSID